MASSGFSGGGGGGSVSLVDVSPIFRSSQWVSADTFFYHEYDDNGGVLPDGDMILIPIPLGGVATEFESIAVHVPSSTSGAAIRLGIYDSDGDNHLPKTLILDAGVESTSTSGTKKIDFAENLSLKGWKYLAIAGNSNFIQTKNFRSATSETEATPSVLGFSNDTISLNTNVFYYIASFSLGSTGAENSFPADIESSVTSLNGDNCPRVMIKVA